jgi:hypothetical protein
MYTSQRKVPALASATTQKVRRFCTALIVGCTLLSLSSGPAIGQGTKVLRQSLIDDEFVFGMFNGKRTQRVLTSLPGQGQLVGLGWKDSIIIAADSVRDRFVTVENFGSGTTSDGRFALVADLKIDGGEPVPQFPWVSKSELALSTRGATFKADGVELDGQHARTERLWVTRFRGIGITTRLGEAQHREHLITQCHTGIKYAASDSALYDSIITGMRDYCEWIPSGAGNCQSSGNHLYGAEYASYNQGGHDYRGTHNVYADCRYGYYGDVIGASSLKSTLTACLFQHCARAALTFKSSDGNAMNCIVNVPLGIDNKETDGPFLTYGVDLQGLQGTFIGGSINLTKYKFSGVTGNFTAAAAALRITGNNCKVDTILTDVDARSDSTGVVVDAGIKGGNFRFRCYGFSPLTSGFAEPNERLLKVNNTGLVATTFVFEAPGLDTTNPGKYLDIGGGWSTTNSFTFTNTTTGASVTINDGAAY